MGEAIRVSPQEARQKVTAGSALLVCAYEDEEKFRMLHLEGGMSFNEFRRRADSLSRNQEIIFYCA
ncbi:MAG TPA: hypothetical protein VN260_04675 [Dissulfurispiraceae bacterium]|nr:hypothetical protein [Dissulfurispiraceae bacterium]